MTGSCGHPYKTRTVVRRYLYAGLPLTEEVWELVDKDLEESSAVHAERLCPDCFAEQELRGGRRRLEIFAETFGREPLPYLEGSLRQVSYAESVREDIYWRFIYKRFDAIYSAFHETTIGEELLYSALPVLSEKYGVQTREAPSEDILVLQKQVVKGSYVLDKFGVGRHFSPPEHLAVWLLLRKEWTDEYRLFDERRPKVWVANRITRQEGTVRDPDPRTVATAVLVSRLTHWETRETAEQAFRFLLGVDDSYSLLLSLLKENTGSTWEQIIEDALIWKNLQPNPVSLFPF